MTVDEAFEALEDDRAECDCGEPVHDIRWAADGSFDAWLAFMCDVCFVNIDWAPDMDGPGTPGWD
jgi:hypothetical protein